MSSCRCQEVNLSGQLAGNHAQVGFRVVARSRALPAVSKEVSHFEAALADEFFALVSDCKVERPA